MPLNINYYADPRKNTNVGGTTPETARQWFAPMIHFFDRAMGQTLHLARGCYHDIHTAGYDLPGLGSKAHLTIRGYGDGDKPMIDGRNWIEPNNTLRHFPAAQFVYEAPADGGGHVWSIQAGGNAAITGGGNTPTQVFRVFAGARNYGILLGQRTIGEALRRIPDRNGAVEYADIPQSTLDTLAHIKANLTADCPWYGAGSALGYKLYMWTPSSLIDPAAYYGGLAFTQSGQGTVGFNVVSLSGAQDIEINGIDVIGARNATFSIFANDNAAVPTANIRIIDCDAYCALTGWDIRSVTTQAGIDAGVPYGVQDVLVRGCTGNSNSGAREQEPNKTQYGRLSGASDMFYLRGHTKNCVFEDCLSINSLHSAGAFGGFDSRTANPAACGFRRVGMIASEWNTYSRGFGTFMCQDSCFLDQCWTDGANVHSQYFGAPLITGFRAFNARQAERNADDTDGHVLIWAIVSTADNNAIGNYKYFQSKPTNVRFVNCSFGPTFGTPFKLQNYSDGAGLGGLPMASIAAGSVTVENCVFDDNRPERADKPVMSTGANSGAPQIPSIPFRNVALHKYGDAAPKVSLHGVEQAAATASGFTNVVTADPMLGADLRPLAGSPLRGAGVQTKLSAARDASGRRFNATPSIGAFEIA